MPHAFRRVVTGHTPEGKATVLFDSALDTRETRPGAASRVIWTTKGLPADNDDPSDAALRPVGTSEHDGTVFRIVHYAPGVTPRNHRTSSVDYAVVLSGAIDMVLDDETVHLAVGDVLVQRGTIHNWVNNGSEPCVIAFVLVGANPATRGGAALPAIG